jgi:hypothetical protein
VKRLTIRLILATSAVGFAIGVAIILLFPGPGISDERLHTSYVVFGAFVVWMVLFITALFTLPRHVSVRILVVGTAGAITLIAVTGFLIGGWTGAVAFSIGVALPLSAGLRDHLRANVRSVT